MENRKQIIEWIESKEKDHVEGIALLASISKNKHMIAQLSKKDSPANIDKINYELSKLIRVEYKTSIPIQEKPKTTSKHGVAELKEPIELGKKTEFDSLPLNVQEKFKAKRFFYNERNKLSQRVQDLTANQVVIPLEVHEIVKEILSIDEEIKSIDSIIEYFWKYNALPVSVETKQESKEEKVDVETAKELLKKRIKNQNTYITKAKQKSEKHPENMRYKEDLVKKQHELKNLLFQRDSLSTN
jgi:hypothetical protein